MVNTRFTEGDGSINRARMLRREQTPAETKLWAVVRGSALGGHKVRRQQRLGRYVADFVCQARRLVIEVDGDTHADEAQVRHDRRRTAFMESEGYRVLRFSNVEVMGNIDGVASVILDALAPSPSHAAHGPLPLPHGERSK